MSTNKTDTLALLVLVLLNKLLSKAVLTQADITEIVKTVQDSSVESELEQEWWS